jgi:serine/threonine protein kinase/predicted ATPase
VAVGDGPMGGPVKSERSPMDPNSSRSPSIGEPGRRVASFLAEWSEGRRPRIEALLAETAGEHRAPLVEQLLAHELESRRGRGERPSVEEYLERFPEFAAQVEGVFQGTLSFHDVPSSSKSASRREESPYSHLAFGPYRVVGVLGQGGMGVVFRAQHYQTRVEVAVKTVRVRKRSLLHRIRREILALARIRHPGLVSIIETGQVEGQPWYAMESIRGVTFNDFLAKARSPSHSTEWLGPGQPFTSVDGGPHGALAAPRPAPLPTEAWSTVHAPSPSEDRETEVDLPGHPDDHGEGARARPGRKPMSDEDLKGFLRIMARLCNALAYLHGEGVVHRDLKPDNILIRTDETPVLLDFGLASRFDALGREVLEVGGRVEGTPAYMSPEQVRGELVDARADLYAVGCMLYEGVTGRNPFRRQTTQSTFRAHIEVHAVPPREIAPEIPEALDDLILRLLAKGVRDRLGYARDVVAELSKLGGGIGDWAAGLPPRDYLYRPGFVGREDSLKQLEKEVARALDGRVRCIFVKGRSGVGKTRLLMELTRRLGKLGRTVVAGECLPVDIGGPPDGLAVRSTPFHPFRPLLQAIADSCVELGPDEAEFLLGPRADVLAACEPALASLQDHREGEDDPSRRSNDDIRWRLMDALGQTLARFATRGPLVLPLDDLQWADELTLDFLELCQRGVWDISGVAIVGLYRSEEEPEALRPGAPNFQGATFLDLGPIETGGVHDIIGDILGSREPDDRFVRHVAGISEGNPFFVGEFLRAGVAEGLLTRGEGGRWLLRPPGSGDNGAEVDFEALPLPSSLRDLIARRLDGLAEDDRRLVELLSVVGREAEDAILIAVDLVGDEARLAGLGRLISAQIIEESCPEVFRFVHDKLREVAYAEITADRRRELHRDVARALEMLYGDREDFDRRYPMLAYHWHRSIGDRREHPDRVAVALDYLEKSLRQAVAHGLSREAVDYGLAAARLMEVDLPGDPAEIMAAIGPQIGRIMELMAGRRPVELLDLPSAGEPGLDRIVGLLQAIHPPAHMSNQYALSALASAKNLVLTLEKGRTGLAPVVYAMFSTVARNLLQDSRLADEFIRLADEQDDRQGGPFKSPILMVRGWFINHWVRPLNEGLATCQVGARAGFATGDLLYACYCEATYVVLLAETGAPLDRVVEAAMEGIARIDRRVFVAYFHCILERQFARAMAGRTKAPSSLTDDEYDETRDLASICRTANFNQIGYYHIYKLRLHYHRGSSLEAVACADEAWKSHLSIMGQTAEVELTCFHALALLALAGVADDARRPELLEKARSFGQKVSRWAEDCEANFRHRAQLIDAEIAQVEGRDEDAIKDYTLSASGATARGFPQHAALAHELAGRHHARLADLDSARASFLEARLCYRRWGADSKVEEIDLLIRDIGPA